MCVILALAIAVAHDEPAIGEGRDRTVISKEQTQEDREAIAENHFRCAVFFLSRVEHGHFLDDMRRIRRGIPDTSAGRKASFLLRGLLP